jgi:hypothetical protein
MNRVFAQYGEEEDWRHLGMKDQRFEWTKIWRSLGMTMQK